MLVLICSIFLGLLRIIFVTNIVIFIIAHTDLRSRTNGDLAV